MDTARCRGAAVRTCRAASIRVTRLGNALGFSGPVLWREWAAGADGSNREVHYTTREAQCDGPQGPAAGNVCESETQLRLSKRHKRNSAEATVAAAYNVGNKGSPAVIADSRPVFDELRRRRPQAGTCDLRRTLSRGLPSLPQLR